MEFFVVLVDLIKGIAWPIVIGVIAWIFRSNIGGVLGHLPKVLDRVRELPGGTKLCPAEEEQQARLGVVTSRPSLELKQIPGLGRTPAIEMRERAILSLLDEINEDERVSRLTRALAESCLSTAFERIYRIIYGSQISMLRLLNENPHFREHHVRDFFSRVKDRFPEIYANYTFDRWLDFLKTAQLAVQIEDRLQISDVGRDFLTYLTLQGLPEAKPG